MARNRFGSAAAGGPEAAPGVNGTGRDSGAYRPGFSGAEKPVRIPVRIFSEFSRFFPRDFPGFFPAGGSQGNNEKCL